MRTIGVVLAAGASKRFGSPKQLAIWQGQPLIIHAITTLQAAGCSDVYAVLGASSSAIRDVIDTSNLNVTILDNPDWATGQSSSIRVACQAIKPLLTPADDVLISLCDQPQIPVSHFKKLIHERRSNNVTVTATSHSEGGGVPACFGAAVIPHLLELKGDQGAKQWIHTLADSQLKLLNEPAADHDIDTPHDLNKVRGTFVEQPRFCSSRR